MTDTMGSGLLQGWIALWGQELLWLLAGTVMIVAVGALLEGVAAIRAHRR